MMRIIDPKETPTKDLHQYLLGSVAPRPIAFASTISDDGVHNVAPYSFFNAFSSNPPILVFSSNRRVADNTTKDTLANIRTNGEVVINVVSYNIVRQMAVASIGYPEDVSEYTKAGLTPIASDLVRPYRVKESPVQMECKVRDIITLGDQGGAGHLILCDVVRMHIDEAVLDGDRINPHKIDLMGRMGRAYYVRASGDAVHTIVQSVVELGVGFDGLPDVWKASDILTGNDLGRLAGLTHLPKPEDAATLKDDKDVKAALDASDRHKAVHQLARDLIAHDEVQKAAKVLWLAK